MPDIARAEDIRRDATAKQRAIDCLWQLGGRTDQPRRANLYAILDAARDPGIYQGLRRLQTSEQVIGLYQGPTARELAGVAPYLISLGASNAVFDWIWTNGWGGSWGIFFWSLVSIDTLRAHFRRLTMVRGPDGKRMLFRYYDPRVLRVFMPGCDAGQIKELFGPVTRFHYEDEDGTAILTARAQGDRVLTTATPLTG
ncbi:MAG: DUF4123 domain-containing protein [Acetobacteraceae bacterium]|nr:DUF4123 domain-containing protein [Acetobacteraceae bacterium]